MYYKCLEDPENLLSQIQILIKHLNTKLSVGTVFVLLHIFSICLWAQLEKGDFSPSPVNYGAYRCEKRHTTN